MRKLFIILFLLLLVSCLDEKGDIPYTKEKVLNKSYVCYKQGMDIQMICDDQLNVYAVKCIPSIKDNKK